MLFKENECKQLENEIYNDESTDNDSHYKETNDGFNLFAKGTINNKKSKKNQNQYDFPEDI